MTKCSSCRQAGISDRMKWLHLWIRDASFGDGLCSARNVAKYRRVLAYVMLLTAAPVGWFVHLGRCHRLCLCLHGRC